MRKRQSFKSRTLERRKEEAEETKKRYPTKASSYHDHCPPTPLQPPHSHIIVKLYSIMTISWHHHCSCLLSWKDIVGRKLYQIWIRWSSSFVTTIITTTTTTTTTIITIVITTRWNGWCPTRWMCSNSWQFSSNDSSLQTLCSSSCLSMVPFSRWWCK